MQETNNQNEILVVYNSKTHMGIFDYLFHFKAVKLNDHKYQIVDVLGRCATQDISAEEFLEKFVILEAKDFAEYEGYVNNGDTDLIDSYYKKIKRKYNLN